MNRWFCLLVALGLMACIEDVVPLEDPQSCTPDACGETPTVARCPDGNGPMLTCKPQADDACGWTIAACEVPPGPGPEPPDPNPEPMPGCTPNACGPPPDGGDCPPGQQQVAECRASAERCEWLTRCEPDDCCDPANIPAGEPCGPGFDGTLACIGCEWVLGCEPNGMCGPDDCGPPVEGEPCGPGERRIEECQATDNGCEWYVACERIDCNPGDCMGEPPMPNCAEYTTACVPVGANCNWQVECNDVCALPFDPGPCNAVQPVWWYNAETNDCEERVYGGCEGNGNRFASPDDCFDRCGVLGK